MSDQISSTHIRLSILREVEEAAHLLAPAPFGLETSLSENVMQVAEVYSGGPARNVVELLAN